MKIIVGLGNPGKEYQNTRHNAGFMGVDKLAENLGLPWHRGKKFSAAIAEGNGFILAKPLTFMNLSGQSVRTILSYYKLLPKKIGLFVKKSSDLKDIITIIHDDLDIPLGKFKLASNSRSAGHNGVQSIIDQIKTKNFTRLRLGIKTQAREQVPAEKFVLENFSTNEIKIISDVIDEALKIFK
jgi:PTH1 family peptidyl-tRNA hydrolase